MSSRLSRRSARLAGAVLLGGVIVAGAFGVLRAQVGCGGMTGAQVEAGAGEEAGVSGEAGQGAGASACVDPIAIEVEVLGSYTQYDTLLDFPRPSLMTRYSFPHFVSHPAPHSFVKVELAEPFFAAAYAAIDLCSTEEASSSHLRLSCIGRGGRQVTIEYRLDRGRDLVVMVDGRDMGHDGDGNARITQIPPGSCGALSTRITKHDLEPLQERFLDDAPSARCRANGVPRRKVPVTLAREPLTGASALGVARYASECGRNVICRDSTRVNLVLPPALGPSQDLGILGAQCCGPCTARRLRRPNGIDVACHQGYSIVAYQLGDALYVVEDDHVRQVPLPCGVELDFRLAEFVAPLGIPANEIRQE